MGSGSLPPAHGKVKVKSPRKPPEYGNGIRANDETEPLLRYRWAPKLERTADAEELPDVRCVC